MYIAYVLLCTYYILQSFDCQAMCAEKKIFNICATYIFTEWGRCEVKIEMAPDGALALAGLLLSESKGLSIVIILCAAMHELGHIFAARCVGVRLERLRLGLFGARIYPSGVMSYREEFVICACGPAVSATLSLVTFAGLFLYCGMDMSEIVLGAGRAVEELSHGEVTGESIAYMFICVSFMQAIMNLIPAEGFDGGRMMSSLISHWGNERISHISESAVTVLTAVCLWLFSVYILIRTGSGIGIFVCAMSIFARKFIKK